MKAMIDAHGMMEVIYKSQLDQSYCANHAPYSAPEFTKSHTTFQKFSEGCTPVPNHWEICLPQAPRLSLSAGGSNGSLAFDTTSWREWWRAKAYRRSTHWRSAGDGVRSMFRMTTGVRWIPPTLLKTNPFVVFMALNFSKAFDSVRHAAVLVYKWIQSFFQYHSHCTRFGNEVSTLKTISAGDGVP